MDSATIEIFSALFLRNHHEPTESRGLLHQRQARGVRATAGRHCQAHQELPPADAPAQLQPDERAGLAVVGPDPERPGAAGPAGGPGRPRCPHPGRTGQG